jgi:hypothetical protein
MRPSSHTLLGRAHERIRLEASRDIRGLYELLDPSVRMQHAARGEGEREATLSSIEAFVGPIETAEVVEIEVLEARKVSEAHGGRAAALVRSLVRYNGEEAAKESRTEWVRDQGVWYAATLADES